MIQLTEEQANTVVQLIDAAVRSGGLQLAKAAIPIVDDIVRQIQEPPPCTVDEQQQY